MRNATLALAALAALAAAPQAAAQCAGTPGTDFEQVTVRQINAIPEANINTLNAGGADLTIEQIQELLTNDLEGELVEIQSVFLSDPLLSGLATSVDGIPGRIHAFVRDVSAITDGPAGNTIQIVDPRGDGEIQQFFPGDEVVVCGFVDPFTGSGGKAMQITPVSITAATNPVWDPVANPEFDDPVTVSIDDFHDAIGDQTQLDFSAFSSFNGQYVRLENTTLVQGIQGTRTEALFSDDAAGGAPQINLYDTSVCFRNDRDADYFPSGQVPACIDDDFVPPATGVVNVQGFLVFQGDDGNFNYGIPDEAHFVISPSEDGDFEVASAPPIVSLDAIAGIPAAGDDVTVSATVAPGEGTVSNVTGTYSYVLDGTEIDGGSFTFMNTSGDVYEGTIPGLASSNGAFVEFTLTATNSAGGTTNADGGYLVFSGAVDSISRIQRTAGDAPGASPLYTQANGENNADDPRAFDLDAVVQEVFQRGNFWYGSLQDDEDLDPWTGIWVFFGGDDPNLSPGDRINITEAAINERFEVTQIEDLTFTVTSSGAPYGYKTVPTGVLTDEVAAEAHEGMLLSFEDVTITNNDTGFGEWAFATDGNAADAVEADDWADAFDDFDPSTFFANGEVREFIRGIWWFSFGEYKLAPVTLDDIGAVAVSSEGGANDRALRILGTRPNPVSATATVAFELDTPGTATLRLYDTTGREVAVVAEGDFAARSHTAEVDVSALASGVYVLRLEAAGQIATARIAVVR